MRLNSLSNSFEGLIPVELISDRSEGRDLRSWPAEGDDEYPAKTAPPISLFVLGVKSTISTGRPSLSEGLYCPMLHKCVDHSNI